MEASVAGDNRLLIRRFQARYLVSREHPAPERLKSRLDETVIRDLAPMLATHLEPLFPKVDASLWLIRSLDVDLDVNLAWEQGELARVLVSRIAQSLAIGVHGGLDGDDIVWFPSRAAYLARFLVDAAEGGAWCKWYYESFTGLRPLPLSATLRTAICDRPSIGRASLQLLTHTELTKVLSVLTALDASRILDRLSDDETAGEVFRCFQAAWDAMRREPPNEGADRRNALRLYLTASRDRTDVGGLPLRTAVSALLSLPRYLGGGSAAEAGKRLTALTGGDRAALYVAAGTAAAEALLPLLRCPPAWVQEVAETLLGGNAGQMADETPHQGPRDTPFGGIFLMLALLDELPLEAATCGWPDTEAVTAVAAVRFLLLLKCCGQPRVTQAFYDPLVRDLMGIAPPVTPPVLANWQRGISPANLQRFQDTLTTWHRERGAVRDRTWVLARIPAPGSPPAVLIDGARGVWLFAGAYPSIWPQQFLDVLQGRRAQGALEGHVLLSDPAFIEALGSRFPDQEIVNLFDDGARTMAAENQQLAEILERLDKLPDDLVYLSLPKSWGLAGSFDRTLSVAAQGLMRALAWRLPGFTGSNLSYLYSNFLDFAASLEEEPARRVVRLGRPALHLVLNMTGMARNTYALSWLDERPLALFPEG